MNNNWKLRKQGELEMICYGNPELGKDRFDPPSDGLIVEYLGKVKVGPIEMDETTKRKPVGWGVVLAVGSGRRVGVSEVIPCESNVGDTVMYHPANATVLSFFDDNGKEHEYLKISEQQVLTFINQ